MGQGLTVVVLAAGEGKRFRSALPKPLHPVAGRPLLWHVLAAATPLKADRTVVVVGNGADRVTAAVEGFDLGPVDFAVQADQRGTGDALAAAVGLLGDAGDVLVLSGDTPLVSTALLERLLDTHRAARAAATLLTCTFEDPTGYGRVLRDPEGAVTGIVEERDATPTQRRLREVGAGMYVFRRPALNGLASLRPDNDQGEYYLPDLVPQVLAGGGLVATFEGSEEEARGVNDRVELAAAETALRRRLLERLMLGGVTVTDPAEGSKAGTFVEVKNSVVGPGSKVPHLSYVGDADIGTAVNVGAGTVFVNYDGARKHRTTVGDGAFIGSDTMLVAPVTVGNGAQTAAGSTITKDVPPDALAIERSDQRTIEGWAARRRRRKYKE
jgi:bifunctional UDP-N-acetylglucosamine pyrophosphorylase/glucosamine-1-phosphate N-acetyltransferase